MTNALIVIDLQNDFCPGGQLAVSSADEVVRPINIMMDDYDLIVLSQDRGGPRFWTSLQPS